LRATGIENSLWANSLEDFTKAVAVAMSGYELYFIGAKVSTERAEVPPYPIDEVENKYRFIRHVEETAGIEILKRHLPASYD
jgi:hypothetical protein